MNPDHPLYKTGKEVIEGLTVLDFSRYSQTGLNRAYRRRLRSKLTAKTLVPGDLPIWFIAQRMSAA